MRQNGHAFPGVLSDPKLDLRDRNGALLRSNDNWMSSAQKTQIQTSGLAPGNSHEAAVIANLPAGTYTAVVTGVSNKTGIALAEIYDLDRHSSAQLVNLSARANVMTGNDVLIDGLIIGSGVSRTVVFRGIGPSLTARGVSGALHDPMLDLYNSNGVAIGHNDNWQSASNHADIQSKGFAPTDNRESTIMMTLPGGNYTAILRGVNNTTGIALLEAYRLQQ